MLTSFTIFSKNLHNLVTEYLNEIYAIYRGCSLGCHANGGYCNPTFTYEYPKESLHKWIHFTYNYFKFNTNSFLFDLFTGMAEFIHGCT